MQIRLIILKGGSGGTTSAPSSSSQTVQPWSKAQPFIKSGYAEAAKLYAQGPQQYTPWSQAAQLDPNQKAQIQGTFEYANSPGTQQFMGNVSNSVQNLMNGTNNPYAGVSDQTNPALAGYLSNNNLNDPSAGLNRFMYDSLQNPALQGMISKGAEHAEGNVRNILGNIQNKFGFGKNIGANSAEISKRNTVNNAFSQAFDTQNANRLQAINMANAFNNGRFGIAGGLLQNAGEYLNNSKNLGFQHYAPAINAPLQLLGQVNKMGGINQAQNQAQLQDATNRWNFNQQAPYAALNQYATAINPDRAWGNTYTGQNAMSTAAGIDPAATGAAAASTAAALYGAYK